MKSTGTALRFIFLLTAFTGVPVPVFSAPVFPETVFPETVLPTAQGEGATDPIEGPGSIASLERVLLGGVSQWITIRGADTSLPLLLWLHGGPGWTEMPFRSYQRGLEDHFIVVHWDQRGAGKSFIPNTPKQDMNMDRLIEDTASLVKALLERFGRKKLYLLGHSWGAVLGILTVQNYPDLFHAFAALGQPVNSDLEDELGLDFLVETARRRQDTAAITELNRVSLPHPDWESRGIMWRWLIQYGGMVWQKRELIDLILDPRRLRGVPEYTDEDWRRRQEGIGFSSECFRSEMRNLDLFSSVSALAVPVYFLLGAHDHQVPFEASEEFYNQLEAPFKELVWFHESAHFPHMEEPEKFEQMLVAKLLVEFGTGDRGTSR